MSQLLLCTVGTSLFRPNLEGLRKALADGVVAADRRLLAEAYAARDWPAVAAALGALAPDDRLCGAEINSVASMIAKGHASPDAGLFFFHSATADGRAIGEVLALYFRSRGHAPVEAVEVADLQDADPKRFRTHGLRNLARALCRVVRERSASACAINATGGYKAQIAVAVLLGQALHIPVYYKHEQFSEIIAFPPLPVALDFEVWLGANALLHDLAGGDVLPFAPYRDGWDERFESLVERETVDGVEVLTLSPAGLIFHETFRQRWRSTSDVVLPPPAPPGRKKAPVLKSNEGHMLAHRDEIERFLGAVTAEVPQVVLCATSYFNPDLPERTRFRAARGGVEGSYSGGSWTVKFRVETTAETEGQRRAVVAALNEWLAARG
jgi:putative CRISPR-associated protein (TIGR02619 family)